MSNIAIFASGSGTNAQAIIEHFLAKNKKPVKLILSNKADAFVLERAKKLNIKSVVFNRELFYTSNNIIDILKSEQIDLIVLAGFLWLIPDNILKEYSNRIINIHPALLPKYGGKGMYGMKVHEAVVANKESVSGITIHYVNEEYDRGKIIFQASCTIDSTDTAEMVANKIHTLEHTHFPTIVERIAEGISI
jgi:phosphoribosylglycinamide formyltransferase-1